MAPRGDRSDADEEDEPPARRRRGGRRPHPHHPPIRSWDSSGTPDGEEEGGSDDPDEETAGERHLFRRGPKERVYFRARDSIYFEPLVALAIIVLLLVSLYAYTANWPPVYVVESNSMQHGTADILGLINTGDLVLAQRVPPDQVRTYVDGEHTGYTTYGEYGDVLLYNPNGLAGTPVIHRAILFLEYNPNGTWNAPSLAGLTCGGNASDQYEVQSTGSGCGTQGLSGTITLRNVGWQGVTVVIPLTSMGRANGFVTMGDKNYVAGSPGTGITDQSGAISALVQPGWIVGVARGSLPWVGSVKLLLQGEAQEVPSQSWEYLGLSLVALILLAMGIHYALRAEGVEDPRRKAEEEEAEDDEEEDGASGSSPGERGRRNWLHPIAAWREEHPGEDEEEEPPVHHRGHARAATSASLRGRPEPKVGRSPARGKHKKRRATSEDEEEDL